MFSSSPESNSVMTSAGRTMSSASWLDAHYLACEPEYEAMIRSAGIQAGWHVLDAGCGTGGFLKIIAELVGASGRISAVDLASEHIATVQARAGANQFACPVDGRVADVKALPFDDGTFDAVWSANVTQYLSPPELRQMLSEFRRVLKPGGMLAIKDGDITALQMFPISPTLLWRLLDAWARRGDQQIAGLLGSLWISRYMREAGLIHVNRRVTFIERSAPLRRAESQFVAELVEFFKELAASLDLSEADISSWREFSDAKSPKYILKRSDFYLREAAVLIIGYEPSPKAEKA